MRLQHGRSTQITVIYQRMYLNPLINCVQDVFNLELLVLVPQIIFDALFLRNNSGR